MKKFKLVSALCVFATLLFITGCTTVNRSVPATDITGSIDGQPFKLHFAKQVSADKIKVLKNANEVSVEITNLKSDNDPAVITTTGDAQAKIIAAGSQAFQDGMKAASAAAGTVAGAVVKP